MLLSMSETPVTASVEPVREEERWAPVELPPGGLTLHPLEAWTKSPIGPAVILAAAFSAATTLGRTVIGGQELGNLWFDILNGVIFAYIPRRDGGSPERIRRKYAEEACVIDWHESEEQDRGPAIGRKSTNRNAGGTQEDALELRIAAP